MRCVAINPTHYRHLRPRTAASSPRRHALMGYPAGSSSGQMRSRSDRAYASSGASVIPQHVHDVLKHDAGTGAHLRGIVMASTTACSPLSVRSFLRLAGLERVPLSGFASLAAKPVNTPDDFVRCGRYYARNALVLDVRSPGEYALGRLPGAINLPLFTDEERAMVGTVYKQKVGSRDVHSFICTPP